MDRLGELAVGIKAKLFRSERPATPNPDASTTIPPATGEQRTQLIAQITQRLEKPAETFTGNDLAAFNTDMITLLGGETASRTHRSDDRPKARLTRRAAKFSNSDGRNISFYSQAGGSYGSTDIEVVTGQQVESTEYKDDSWDESPRYSTYNRASATLEPGLFTDIVAAATKVAGRDAGQIAPKEPYLQGYSDGTGQTFTSRNKMLTPSETREFCKRVFKAYQTTQTPAAATPGS